MNYTKEEMLNTYNGTYKPTNDELKCIIISKEEIADVCWWIMPDIMTYNVLRRKTGSVVPPEKLIKKYGIVSSVFKVKDKSYNGYSKKELMNLYQNDAFTSELYDIVNSNDNLLKRYSEQISKHELSNGFVLSHSSNDYLFDGIYLKSGMGYHYFGDGIYVEICESGVYSGDEDEESGKPYQIGHFYSYSNGY